ncbi:MAG: hypothetical protein MJY62_00730 [Bacteroidales bacterium]|nr:hypothetical protein [Bacteroidales bacterium]
MEINVEAEAEEVTVKVSVKANRSWRASVKDDENDWVYISGAKTFTTEDGVEGTFEINVKFENNTTTAQRTNAIVFKGDGIELEIPVTQKGKVSANTLATTSETSYTNIPWSGGEFRIAIQSNASWSATVGEKDPENFNILKGSDNVRTISKFQDDEFTVKVGPNLSTSTVSGTVTVVDDDKVCTPIVFTFSQASAPSVTIDSVSTSFAGISSYGFKRTLVFNAADTWTATASQGLSIDKASGNAGNAQVITFTAEQNTLASDRTLSITVKGKDNATFTASWTQYRVPDYEVIWDTYPDMFSKDAQYRNWHTTADADGTWGLFTTQLVNNSYGPHTLSKICPSVSEERIVIDFFSNYKDPSTGAWSGNFSYDYTGFLIGQKDGVNGDNSYRGGGIILPAIKGKRLSRVEFFNAGITDNQGSRIRITDADNQVVEGGKEQIVTKNLWGEKANSNRALSCNSIHEDIVESPGAYAGFELPSTKAETAYYIRFSVRTTVRWFTFYYENAQ